MRIGQSFLPNRVVVFSARLSTTDSVARHARGFSMIRLPIALLILGVAAVGGCATCSQVYDYCPPTFTEHGICDPMARANSVLSPPLPIASGAMVDGAVY